MNNIQKYNIGGLVSHSSDNCPFEVVGIRKEETEIKGDFSGGTHNVLQTSCVNNDEIKHYAS